MVNTVCKNKTDLPWTEHEVPQEE